MIYGEKKSLLILSLEKNAPLPPHLNLFLSALHSMGSYLLYNHMTQHSQEFNAMTASTVYAAIYMQRTHACTRSESRDWFMRAYAWLLTQFKLCMCKHM